MIVCACTAQAKAVMLEETFATFQKMKAEGIGASTMTLSLLLSACKRAKQPQKALQIITELTQQGWTARFLFQTILWAMAYLPINPAS